MIFIDGQNLLYACRNYANEKGQNYKFFLREEDLEQCLINLQPNRKHIQTRFYTSILPPDPDRGDNDLRRFERQFKKKQVLETKLKWYVFQKKTNVYPFFCPHCKWKGIDTQVVCQKCGNPLREATNKGVDVALATDLLTYGMANPPISSYDVAILVTGDNDFIPVIERLKDRRPQIKIEIAQFSSAVGFPLKRAVDKFYALEDCADKIGKLHQKMV